MATLTIMRLTFLEAIRRRIALAAFLLGAAFIVLYAIGLYFILHEGDLPTDGQPGSSLLLNQVFNFLSIAGMYAVNFLGIALGALVSADTLAGEISSGTIQAIVTKPLRRAEVVLGKWLGFAGLLGIYLGLMLVGVVSVIYFQTGYVVPNVVSGILLIYLEALVIMTLTLACSSTVSTLATGGVVFGLWGLAFVGGFVEQIGAVLQNTSVINVGVVSSLILPTEALFRRAAYEMTSPLVRAMGISTGPTFVISVPSPAMAVYAAIYLAAFLALAVRQFSRRDL